MLQKIRLRNFPLRRILPDIALIILSLYISLYIRLGPVEIHEFLPVLHRYLAIFVVIRVVTLAFMKIYDVIWRYISASDAVQLFRAVLLSSVLVIAISYLLPDFGRLPRSVFFIDSILLTLLLMGARLARRISFEGKDRDINEETGIKTLIYGAGHNGRTLAQRFRSDGSLGVYLAGFVDDDPKKQGAAIAGFNVLGTMADISRLIEERQIQQLIVAISDLNGETMRELVRITRPFNVRPRITAKLQHSLSGKNGDVTIYRDVDLRDLLNRPTRQVNARAMQEMLKGKRVLIAGAGGSIGSELARQVLRHGARRLILLDHSEFNLYQIDTELRLSNDNIERIVPLLVDIKDKSLLSSALRRFDPEVILHAAAYKHVHLVEANPHSAILNNILGTRNLLEIAQELDVETFVLISTDKAVNPAGIMGATKRACELLTIAMGKRTGKRYTSVRFGNVLGSSGSLIPLFKQQIIDGGPLTVTHKDMTRYFMLIPEAVSLVLNAATIANSGDIEVLRMGDPVKILDVARSLIALMGKTEEEIQILFTGVRPGEKISEQLYLRGDEIETEHPDILILPHGESDLTSSPTSLSSLDLKVDKIIAAAKGSHKEALFELNQLVKSTYQKPDSKKSSTPSLDKTH